MQQNTITEFHTVRVSVGIKHIHLLVRFPCRLSFQLKTENGSTQTVNTYELKKGQCQVNETIQIDFDVAYDNQRRCYQDKKIKLVVMMSSANGIIPAGMITFNLCQSQSLQRIQQTLNLQKCPDRTATIKFTRWYQFLRTTNNGSSIHQSNYLDTRYTLKNNNNRTQLKHSTYTTQNYGRSSKYSPAKRDLSPNQLTVNNNNGVTPRSKVRTYTSPIYQNGNQQQQIYSNNNNNAHHAQQDYRMAQSYMQQPSYGHTASFYPMNQSSYVGNQHQTLLMQSQFGSQGQKLEFGQKANLLKQIARLKGEIKSLQNQDKWQQLIRVKDQNQTLTIEVQKQKQKYRNIQKKDRQYNITIKELKDELERVRLKLINTQSVKNQAQLNINQKDKKLKDSINQIKKLQQKISDLNITISTNQKRIQFKQASFHEQLTKMTEKYNQSESQRQKITFQYNSLLSKMEEGEKKYQLNIKQKQRFWNEEKNKLNKKIDTLSQQYEKLKQEHTDRELAFGDLTTNHKLLSKKQADKQSRLTQLQNELQYANMAFKKEQQQRKTLQSQITILRSIQQQRNSLKKKYNQTYSQFTKTKQRLDHTVNDFNHLTNKSKQQQSSINQLKKQKSQLNSRINILTKQIEQLTKLHDKKSKEQQMLSAQHMNNSQRINDLRTKLQTQQRDYNEMQDQYEEQIGYFTKAKEYAETEIQDLKWTVEKQREQYEELVEKFKESTEQILMLNKEILQGQDRFKRLQEEYKQSQSNNKILFNQKLALQQKQRQSQQSIKFKTNQNYQLSKRKLQLEQEVYLLKQKLQQSLNFQKDKFLTDQKSIKQKQKEINILNQQSTKGQLQILHLKQEINSINQTLSIRTNQISHLKDNNQLFQEKINQFELKNEQLREELKNSNFQLTNARGEIESYKAELLIGTKALQKIKNDWQQYRTNTTNALQQLIIQISKDQDLASGKQQNLLIFPDMNISSMQVQAIKKRNSIISYYRQKISELQKQVNISRLNLQKLKKKSQQKQAELEFIITKQKQKTKQLLVETSQQREVLTQQLRKHDDKNIELSSQVEKLSNQIKKSYQIIEQTKSENKELLAEKEHLRLEIKNLQEKILTLKSNQIKSKASHESKFSQLNDHSEQQLLRLKAQLLQNQRKFLSHQKVVSEKQQSIKKLQNQITSLTNQRNRIQQKAIQLNEKVNILGDEKKALQKKVKITQKQLKQQLQLKQQALQAISNEKTKLEQIKSKYNETFEQLTDSQVDNEKLKQEIQICNLTISSLDSSIKQKQQKFKSLEQKQSQQLKTIKQSLITLNSQLQLKSFINKQLEDSLSTYKQHLSEHKQELGKKKQQIIRLSDQLDGKKNNILQIDQSLVMNKNQKMNLYEDNERLRARINILESQINQNRILQEVLEMKDKEIRKLKEQVEVTRRHYQKNLAELRSMPSTDRNKLTSSRLNQKNEDFKRRNRELEQLLELKHYDLALQRKKWLTEADREKRQLVLQNNDLNQRVQNMQSQFDFQRTQLNKQIQSLGQQVDDLLRIVQQKQQVIFVIQNLVKDLQNGNTSRVPQLKANVQELKRSIQNRMKENSLSRDRANRNNNSVSNDSKLMMRSNERQYNNDLIVNESRDPFSRLYEQRTLDYKTNILNESIKDLESQKLGTTMNDVQ